MRIGIKAGYLAFGVLGTLGALPAARAQTAGMACLQAATAAEQEAGIPTGLLAAIGQVESGKRDALTGRMLPWPWAINSQGVGRWFDSAEDAARAVVTLQARGVRSIDMGCFQVNAQHHAAAFATLGEAFDPLSNARYAARFLTDLRGRTGSWDGAVAAYHSSTPGVGEPYRDRVLAVWQGAPVTLAAARLRDPYVVRTPGGLAARAFESRVVAGAQLAVPTNDPRVVLIAGPGIQIAGPARILGVQSPAWTHGALAGMPRMALTVQ